MLTVEQLVVGHDRSAKEPESPRFQYDLKLEKGQWMAISGPSGVGKSSLLGAIAGLVPVESGDMFWDSRSLNSLPAGQRPLAILFQQNNLFHHLTIAQNLALGINPSGTLTSSQQQRLQDTAKRLAIDSLLNRKPHELSGGQNQRAALARALLRQAPLLLLDEPFNGLDKALRLECISLLEDINQQDDITILMVTHHPEELADSDIIQAQMVLGGRLHSSH